MPYSPFNPFYLFKSLKLARLPACSLFPPHFTFYVARPARSILLTFDRALLIQKSIVRLFALSVSDFAQPMLNILLSLPAAAGERFRSLDATPLPLPQS